MAMWDKLYKEYTKEPWKKGITDDESTWGMCCCKEAAWKCSRDHWMRENVFPEIEEKFAKGIMIGLIIGVVVGVAITSVVMMGGVL